MTGADMGKRARFKKVLEYFFLVLRNFRMNKHKTEFVIDDKIYKTDGLFSALPRAIAFAVYIYNVYSIDINVLLFK